MANQVELIEGFDQWATTIAQIDRFYTRSSCSLVSASGIMPEGYALFMQNGHSITMTVPADDEYYVGFHWWNGTSGQGGTLLNFMEGATEHGRFVINTDGTVSISRAGSITATSAVIGPFLANQPWFVEVYYKCADGTAGAWEVRVNGTAVIGPTGSLDTRNGGTSGVINAIRFQGGASFSPSIDNVYAASGSAGFLGEGRVVTDVPTSDGALSDWAANTGSDWAAVDDVPADDDTTYVSTSTAGHRSTFLMSTFGVTGTIKALAVALMGRKDDVGVRTVEASLRSGGSNYDDATAWTLTTSQGGMQRIWNVDPDTGVAFVDADIDAIEIGMENV